MQVRGRAGRDGNCRAPEGSENRFIDGFGNQMMEKGGKVRGHLVDALKMAMSGAWDVWLERRTEKD